MGSKSSCPGKPDNCELTRNPGQLEEQMEITKEFLQRKLEEVNGNLDGFKQGYAQALGFVLSVLETKPAETNDTAK